MEQKKKTALLITSNFYPENSGIAVYSSDLAFNILRSTYDTFVLTGLPHYPWWKIPQQYSHLTAGWSKTNGIELIRINHYIPSKVGAFGRARFEFSFWIQGRRALRMLKSVEFDLVVSIMPTVASGLLGRSIVKRFKAKGIVIFQDISSAATLQSGMPGARTLFLISKFLEKRAAKVASKLIVISDEMKNTVLKFGNQQSDIEVIHNYSVINVDKVKQRRSKNVLPELLNKYLILHTGNIGYKQDLLNVVRAAEILEQDSEIFFLIIGHGNQEKLIQKEILGRPNIDLLPFVSADEYPKFLAAADLLLINERPSMREMSLPSKLTSYLMAGRPVIAAVFRTGSVSHFLQGNALIVEPGQPKSLADGIVKLKNNKTLSNLLASKGEEFARLNLSAEAGRKKYFDLIEDLMQEST